MVGLDRVGDLLEHGRLPRLGRRHDEAALALADRREQIDDASRHVGRIAGHLQVEPGIGEQWREILEARALTSLVGAHVAHRVDPQQGGVLLAAGRGTTGPLDVVTLAEGEATDLADRDVDVLRAGQEPVGTKEPEALVPQVEQALDRYRLPLELALLATGQTLEVPIAPIAVAVAVPVAIAATTPAAAAVAGLGRALVGARLSPAVGAAALPLVPRLAASGAAWAGLPIAARALRARLVPTACAGDRVVAVSGLDRGGGVGGAAGLRAARCPGSLRGPGRHDGGRSTLRSVVDPPARRTAPVGLRPIGTRRRQVGGCGADHVRLLGRPTAGRATSRLCRRRPASPRPAVGPRPVAGLAVAGRCDLDAGGAQGLVDDVGLLGPGARLQRHRLGARVDLIW